MRLRTWASWLAGSAAALLLAACGGGGGNSAPATPAAGGTTTPLTYTAKMSVTSGEVGVGRTLTISALAVDSNGVDVSGSTTFDWTSTDSAVATVAAGAGTPGSAVVRGVAPGTTTVQVVATVRGADNTTVQLPAQSATITVVPASAPSYTLSMPATSLSMSDGQELPVRVTLLDSNGSDVSASVSDWAWSSSGTAVQVTASQNSATLKASNGSPTTAAMASVSVSVTAPDGHALAGVIAVTVQKNGAAAYRVVTTKGGREVNALQVFSNRPDTFTARVLRHDGQDVTADFDGTWSYTATSTTLSATEAAGTHDATVRTSLAGDTGPVQGGLTVTAVSSKLGERRSAILTVTENPLWALVGDNQDPMTLLLLAPMPIEVTARMKHLGEDAQYTACKGWAWSSTGPVSLSPSMVMLPNQVRASGTGPGDFTITATCTAVTDNTPLKLVFYGTVR
ncbi:hypothetical protein [Cupriavidus neocaledonicus]|uniref:Lipoprotein n=1 Tax=Cupriavidus neocaledonicus TaxID=1040979 RepID=A0A375HWG4_9BURK|nr:hypothetical protein [Cupriavidus neocaledonicus]SOZ37964.1 putative lipoprotein [Cupriavidus neocaledonicus]SPD61184.1 conserved exported protein of unknown function [Cupriavidus neocaledonicus]